ncbi:hypothetical protein XELAEV_18043788mg [Xenopus laevis]|uniref:Uncharacterized protein n=1 Tax=Xenopus laevis TaxID=8355 RepID=A0A974BXC4_XENLA|nr:hypothetical protein XELAEV_18043788mg [Xenopus laevis]
MRKKTVSIAGQGVRIHLRAKKKTTAPGWAAAVENVQVHKEVVAMEKVPSVMESPKQANTLDVQAQVATESCSSAVGSGSSAAESCSSEAARHAGSQEGSAAGCEEAMESTETACYVAMEVAEEVLREKLNPAAAAMTQVPEAVSVSSTSANINANINAVSVAGVSMPSSVSVPSASVSDANVQCNKAKGSTNMSAGSTNMAAPLTNKTVCDAAVRENVADESSVTEGAGNPPGKRLFRQNVFEVGGNWPWNGDCGGGCSNI